MENAKVKTNQLNSLREYLPAFVTLIPTLFALLWYILYSPDHHLSTYLAVLVIAPTPFAVIWVNQKFKLGLPKYLIILMCTHAVASVDMGTTLGLYWRLRFWDSLVHCYFGFLACATLYYLFFRFRDGKPNFIEFLVIFLLVVSFAALWEVYEFFASMVFKSDMQDVAYQLAQGINPLTDTVVDIMVAAAGALIFLAGLNVVNAIKKRKAQSLAKSASPKE